MNKIKIEREEWGRGKRLDSALRRVDGKKCCLGFAYEQFMNTTIPREDGLVEYPFFMPEYHEIPSELLRHPIPYDEWKELYEQLLKIGADWLQPFGEAMDLGSGKIYWVHLIAEINDFPDISDKTRESLLSHVFAHLGIEVEFV